MVYLYTALYPEAKPVIRHFGLKRKKVEFGFDVYEREGLRLIIMGTGALAAATAVGSSLAFYHAGENDFLVNWGSCASGAEIGTSFVCHKLVDRVSGHTFYPDMICSLGFEERAVITEPCAWEEKEGDLYLHDMESAAVYFSGSYFLAPHQMHFIKVVSDHGTVPGSKAHEGAIGARGLEGIMQEAFPKLLKYLEVLFWYESKKSLPMNLENENELETIYEEFCCSQTMKHSLCQCVRYWKLSGIDYESTLQKMRQEGELPCMDRREGKKKFEEFKVRVAFEH